MQEKYKGSIGITIVTSGALLVLVLYAFARVYIYPEPGFSIDPSRGTISAVERSANPAGLLQIGDRLLAVDGATWEQYAADLGFPLINNVHAGDVLHVQVSRSGKTLTAVWTVPPIAPVNMFISYLEAAEPFAYWVIGTLIFLFVRPTDIRWRLLGFFTFLLAMMTTSASLADSHIWYSAIIIRVCVWISVPVFLQLHHVFPSTPSNRRQKVFVTLYILAGCLAVGELFQLVPQKIVYVGGLITIVGALTGLVVQFYTAPEYRFDLRIILILCTFALIPTFSLMVIFLVGWTIPWWNTLAYLPIPVIPLAYFYTIQRHGVGGLVTRRNRFSTLTVFFFLVFYTTTPVMVIASRLATSTIQLSVIAVFLVILSSFSSIYVFPYFQEWFDRRIMGIAIHPSRLLETYSSSIVTSLDKTHLAGVLLDRILPSLLVRQSTILYYEHTHYPSFLYVQGLAPEQGPFNSDFPLAELREAFETLPLEIRQVVPPSLSWICLALPMRIDNRVSGYWLLGQRDPDDVYPTEERSTLQAIADQTAIALSNIIQADRLRSMYAADIERRELERLHLAAELHDEVLNQLAILVMKSDILRESEEAAAAYHQAVKTIREAINGLRPAMLYYGLGPALETLIEEMDDRATEAVELSLDLVDDHTRYDPQVELYLFRIVQQACNNAIQHANPHQILISGNLSASAVEIEVVDDGVGFPPGEEFDLAAMLSNKHFGLAGMLERAELIGARLEIHSGAGRGSRITMQYETGAEKLVSYDPASSTSGRKTIFTHPLA